MFSQQELQRPTKTADSQMEQLQMQQVQQMQRLQAAHDEEVSCIFFFFL